MRHPFSQLVLALAACFAAIASTCLKPVVAAQGSTAVSVNGAQAFQTIDGFGVNANSAGWNDGELRPALDMLVDELGATIWRVVIDNADWESTNDNTDPLVFDWNYYDAVYARPKFEALWSTIAYLNQKGISTHLIVNVMGPVAPWMGGSRIDPAAEDEWVEMMASFVYYGRVTRGLAFTLLSPVNEPDWDGIEGPQVDQWQYARLMRKLLQRLDAIGLSDIRLVGPDTAAIGSGVTGYMPEMMRDGALMARVNIFGFHNYAGDSGGAGAAIQRSSHPDRRFWITEVTNIQDLLAHLGQGPSAALVWDAYDSVYNHAILAGRGTTPPNDVGNGPPLLAYSTSSRTYSRRKGFYESAQLFRFVRPGARRIAASVSSSSVTAYAFHDQARGRVTIVGRNSSYGDRTIVGTLTNLPAFSRFEFCETTASSNMARRTDVVVSGGAFSVQVGGPGVFTLTASTDLDPASRAVGVTHPPASVVACGPPDRVQGASAAFDDR